jgi:hypothetical protein
MNDNQNTQFVSDVNKFSEETAKEVKTYRKVPVVYIPHKASLRPLPNPGLATLIENAMSVQEVTNLVKKGVSDYKNVSAKTLRKWKKVAEKRITELSK